MLLGLPVFQPTKLPGQLQRSVAMPTVWRREDFLENRKVKGGVGVWKTIAAVLRVTAGHGAQKQKKKTQC